MRKMKHNIRDIIYCTMLASYFSVGISAAIGNFWYKTFFKEFVKDSKEIVNDVFRRTAI